MPEKMPPKSHPASFAPFQGAGRKRGRGGEPGDNSAEFGLLGTASTMGLHMVSGPIVGGALGWLVDGWAGSWPVGAGIGVVLGVAAGFRNVWVDARHLLREQENRNDK